MVQPIWILLKQETVSGSGISWAICKSASHSRQITMPAPHHSVFYRPDALPVAQPTASKHWRPSTSSRSNSGTYMIYLALRFLANVCCLSVPTTVHDCCGQVVCVPDCKSIYRVPLILEDQKVVEFFTSRLGLPLPTPRPRKFLMKWRDLADRWCWTDLISVFKVYVLLWCWQFFFSGF